MEPKHFAPITSHLDQLAEAVADNGSASSHLRTLQQQIDAIARGDVGTFLEHSTDDVTLEVFAPPAFPFVREARGAGAVRRALDHNFSAVTNQRPEVRDVFAEGNRVVLFGRETGVLRSTGVAYDVEFVQRFTFKEGRLAHVQVIAAHSKPVADPPL